MTDQSQSLELRTDHAPAAYGDKPQVKSLAARILQLDPSAKDIGHAGVLLKAQLGIALGLNPLPGTGHIHVWRDRETGQLCVHIGLEGRMALARDESPFSVHTRAMTPEECDYHGVAQHDRGAVAEVYRIDLTQAMVKAGLKPLPAVGIGTVRSNERVVKGRSLAWRAGQRAIKDAIRMVYGFRLPEAAINIMAEAGATFSEGGPEEGDDVIEGTFDIEPRGDPAERKHRAAAGKAALFGDGDEPVTESPDMDNPPEATTPEVVDVSTDGDIAYAETVSVLLTGDGRPAVALPWRSMLLVDKTARPDLVKDGAAIRQVASLITPPPHLRAHLKKHHDVTKWPEWWQDPNMAYDRLVKVWETAVSLEKKPT